LGSRPEGAAAGGAPQGPKKAALSPPPTDSDARSEAVPQNSRRSSGRPARGSRPATDIRHRILRSRIFWLAAFAVAYVAVWIVLFFSFLQSRGAVPARLQAALDPDQGVLIVHSTLASPARWELQNAEATTLRVVSSPLDVYLPIQKAQCREVAKRLVSEGCRGGVFGGSTPFTVAWRHPQNVYATGPTSVFVAAGINSHQTSSAPDLGIGFPHGIRPYVCFLPPIHGKNMSSPDTLTLEAGQKDMALEVGSLSDSLACRSGIGIAFRETGRGPAGGLLLEGVRTAEFDATGMTTELERAAGSIVLEAPHKDVAFKTGDKVTMEGAGPLKSHLSLLGTRGRREVTVDGAKMASIRVDGHELVPTNLSRYRAWVIAAFFSGAGLLWSVIQISQFIHRRAAVATRAST
jgi:hypothetical protein